MSEPRILVVEDDRPIAQAIASRLRAEGMLVEVAFDGQTCLERCRAERFDLVLLDVMLPLVDGLEVLRQLRTGKHEQPVLMLTARDTESDLVIGLDAGADDYMTKPFSPRELSARVRALLRRANPSRVDREKIELNGLTIDTASREVSTGDNIVHLTPTEFLLLSALAEKPGTVFSRTQLLRDVWGYSDNTGERTVDSHVRSLRRKLGKHVIRTVQGVGYALARGDDSAAA